jgi:phospholipase C
MASQPIRNVFVVMLENHSFDNMFAMSGIPGIIHATTADANVYNGTVYNVQSGAPVSMPTDPGHEFPDVVEQLAGLGSSYPWGGPYPAIQNSGFAANYATTTSEGPTPPAADIGAIMACFITPAQLPVLYQLATQFAVCDQWFSSLPGPTWPNRFFVHGASSAGLDHSPTTLQMVEWETVDGFTYPNGSIYDALNGAGIQWRLYNDSHNIYSDDPYKGSEAGRIPQVSALNNVHLWDVHSLSDFASDLQGPYPYQYTFIEPNYGNVVNGTYEGGSSQHPMDDVAGGENLIAAVYEAIRNSPLWNASLLIITYDEHGGFYDSVAPGSTVPPDDGSSLSLNQYGFLFDQLGVRVPAVVVSPWIVGGTVDHTVYDHSSVLATLERLFSDSTTSLRPLTQRDGNANNVCHLLSMTTPRTDCPTSLSRPAKSRAVPRPPISAETQAAIDVEPLPESGNLPGFLRIMHKTEHALSSGRPQERAAIVEQFKTIRTRGQARAYISWVMQKVAAFKASRK